MGVRVGVANLFLDISIGIDDTNTFQLKFFTIDFEKDFLNSVGPPFLSSS